jgi:hypothetical protein
LATPAHARVIAVAALQQIILPPGNGIAIPGQPIIPITPKKAIVTGVPLQPVVAGFTEKHVIAQIAIKPIITATAAQVIIPQITIRPIRKGGSGPEISLCGSTLIRHFKSPFWLNTTTG